MSKTNIISVWKALLSENTDNAKIEASSYIQETAARILSTLIKEDENETIDTTEITPEKTEGSDVIVVSYSDEDADCNFDDDVISVSGKDDYDSGTWTNGKRFLFFIYNSPEEAQEAISRIGDLIDTVPDISVSLSQSEESVDEAIEDASGNIIENILVLIPSENANGVEENLQANGFEVTSAYNDGSQLRIEISPDNTDEEEITRFLENNGVEDFTVDIEYGENLEEDSEDCITVSFPSDGDDTIVNELRDRGFEIKDTHIDDEGNRVIHIEADTDAAGEIEHALQELGVENYNLDSEISEEDTETEVDTSPDGTEEIEDETSTDDVANAFSTLESDFENLKAELEAAGITLYSNVDSDETEVSDDITDLEESFLGYEDVKTPVNKDQNDGKSFIDSKPVKDRIKLASPIKSPEGTLTGDGTKAETSPKVKDLPATKNTVKGNVAKTYTKVSKEGDKSAKINSKEGFGKDDDGKSVID